MNEIIGPIYYTFASDSNPDCQGKLVLNEAQYIDSYGNRVVGGFSGTNVIRIIATKPNDV